MIELEFETHLEVAPEVLWRDVTTMTGVNLELRPLVRLTVPHGCDHLSATNPLVQRGFRSWILLFGVVPIDRHDFSFEEIAASRFAERSRSWLNRSWHHDRRVDAGDKPATSILHDSLIVEPRARLVEPILRPALGLVFRHRHRRLRLRYTRPGS